MDSLEFLESERRKIWEEILRLDNQIKKKTSDYELEAMEASKKCSDYREFCGSAKNEVEILLEDLKTITNEISPSQVNVLIQNIRLAHDELLIKKDEITKKVAELEQLWTQHATYVERIKKLELISNSADDYSSKIETIFKQLAARKKEIDLVYFEIFGGSGPDSVSGETITVTGRKAELDKGYAELKDDFEKFSKSKQEVIDKGYSELKRDFETFSKTKVEAIDNDYAGLKADFENFSKTKLEAIDKGYNELKSEVESFLDARKNQLDERVDAWETTFVKLNERIESLLPRALTAGLSHAYLKKREDEENESKKLNLVFQKYVNWLMAISCIPFGVSISFLLTGTPLIDVIDRIPRMVLSILPLYLPVLWMAVSANKRMKLSKRLVEEYTHKEVLSKTFEGLAKQMENVKDSEVSANLRTRLLYNILEVSSENPGKLISDYNKSDHPLMDALDKSVVLSNAIEKLSRIPGMSKLVNVLDDKTKQILEKEERKASLGIEVATKSDTAE